MSLPVIAILTSTRCPHCVSTRGADGQPREFKEKKADGSLSDVGLDKRSQIKGGHYWSPSFFQKLITGNSGRPIAKYRVYEFFMPRQDPEPMSTALEVSEFTLKPGGGVTRTTYKPSEDKTKVAVYNDGEKKGVVGGNIDFPTFVSTKFPQELTNYRYVYPAWAFFKGSTWDAAVRGTEHLYGYAVMCTLMPVPGADGKIMHVVDRSKQPTQAEDPLVLAAKLDNNSPILQTPASLPAGPPPTGGSAMPDTATFLTAGPACRALGFKIVPMKS